MMNLPSHSQTPQHVYDYDFNPDDMLRMIDGTSFNYSADDMALPFASIIDAESVLEHRSTERNRWPGAMLRTERSRRDYVPANDYSQRAEVDQSPRFWRNRFRRP